MTDEARTMDDHQATDANTASADANRDAADTGDSTASQEASSDGGAGESSDEPRTVPLKALHEERKKRQDLQRQVDKMQGRIEGMSQTATPQQTPEDRDSKFFAGPSEFVDDSLSAHDQKKFANRFQETAAWATDDHEDFQELLAKYGTRADADKRAASSIRYANNPAEEFLKFARKWNKEGANGQKFHGKTMEEIEAKVKSDMEADAKNKAAVDAADSNPNTTAGARGSGNRGEAEQTSSSEEEEPWGLDTMTV